MAKKKPDLTNIFARTEPGEIRPDGGLFEILDEGKISATSVGLREGELQALAKIGQDLGEELDTGPVARNAIMRIAIRRFLESYLAGEITAHELTGYFETPDKPQPKLKL